MSVGVIAYSLLFRTFSNHAKGREEIDALLLNRKDIDKNRWGYVIAFDAVLEMINDGRGKEIHQLLLDGVD